MMTFRLHRLSQSMSAAQHTDTLSVLRNARKKMIRRRKDNCSYSYLDFLSVEFRLDGSESSQLSKLDKNYREKGNMRQN